VALAPGVLGPGPWYVVASSSASPTPQRAGPPTSVVIADDDDDMRRAMREALAAHGDFSVVAEATDGHGLEEVAAATGADLVVLDVRMPGGGAPAARRLTALSPAPVVVAVSASTDAATVASLLRAGAAGFLAKGALGQSFSEDLARISRGHVVIGVPNAAQVLRSLAEQTWPPASSYGPDTEPQHVDGAGSSYPSGVVPSPPRAP
jgi:DNA-binding NarL/FixJ family response regulator